MAEDLPWRLLTLLTHLGGFPSEAQRSKHGMHASFGEQGSVFLGSATTERSIIWDIVWETKGTREMDGWWWCFFATQRAIQHGITL